LDVLRPFRERDRGQKTAEPQGIGPDAAYRSGGGGVSDSFAPLGAPGGPHSDRHYRENGSKKLTSAQVNNLTEAVVFADQAGLTLRAHLTTHWALTMAFDDREGKRAAKVREGLNKQLHRLGVLGGLTGVWVRECKAQTEVSHDHLLFHLPREICTAPILQNLTACALRLVGRHGDGLTSRKAVKLTLYLNGADGRYLLKGGDREAWEKYRLPSSWRRVQGRIYGKRCGTTQNIGPAARLEALIMGDPKITLRSN